jgi:CopG antitoxin of type II toxin-antitoxin system
MMTARRKIPAFRNDREAADYWAKHDSAGYAKDLPAASLKVAPALRQRVAARAKKPVTLRLEERQIAAAKRAAERLSLPYQTLLRMWIAERLAKERVGYQSPSARDRRSGLLHHRGLDASRADHLLHALCDRSPEPTGSRGGLDAHPGCVVHGAGGAATD